MKLRANLPPLEFKIPLTIFIIGDYLEVQDLEMFREKQSYRHITSFIFLRIETDLHRKETDRNMYLLPIWCPQAILSVSYHI